MRFVSIASGSSGNCIYAGTETTHVLIDAGISTKRIEKGLCDVGVKPSELSAICITHEHSDHISGLATLTKQLSLPVYTSRGTGLQLCYRIAFLEDVIHTFRPGESFEVGGLGVESFPTPHDTVESVGYAVTGCGRKAAVVTDLGYVTQEVWDGVQGADLLVAEANHEVEWVQSGPYPYFLKQRILGERGHLSNDAGAVLACSAVAGGARTVVLAHLSAENNTPARAYDTVCAALERAGAAVGGDVVLEVAPRSELGKRYAV